jgi:hypothetical protein
MHGHMNVKAEQTVVYGKWVAARTTDCDNAKKVQLMGKSKKLQLTEWNMLVIFIFYNVKITKNIVKFEHYISS